jgi:hypothetical protein
LVLFRKKDPGRRKKCQEDGISSLSHKAENTNVLVAALLKIFIPIAILVGLSPLPSFWEH